MNENKIYSIETKTNGFLACLGGFLILCLSFVMASFITNYINLANHTVLITIIIFVLCVLLILPNSMYPNNSWCITDEYLEYTSVKTTIEKIDFVRNLLGKYSSVSCYKIKISEIDSINIFYRSYNSLILNSSSEHPIYFGITLKDGSYIAFKSLLTSDHDYYLKAVQYLRDKHNIKFFDKDNLLEVLKDSSQNVVSYIEKIEREKL